MMRMRTAWIAWLLLGLGGCVGVNPEWDTPVAATGWVQEDRCDAAASEEGEDDDDGEDGDDASPSDVGASGACGAALEPGACGDSMTACWTEGGWFCADLQEHDEHCGECFNDCAAYGDATCHEGECFCKGGPWWKLCAEGCADTRKDPTGCGVLCVDCREMFGPDARCETGICAPPATG
jgi:hypothetical protein